MAEGEREAGLDPALSGALTALLDRINAGVSGLPALQDLVELTADALGAAGASFTEYGAAGGRVVAGHGALSFAVGHRVDPTGQVKARILAQEEPVEAPVERLPDGYRQQLEDRRITRMLAVRAQLAGHLVGTLHAVFTGPDRPVGTGRRGLIRLFAAVAAHLYGTNRGLPVYAEGPVVSALADAVVIVDRAGLPTAVSASAAVVLGVPEETASGQPLPVPLPQTGQLVQHRLPDGRWLQILATELPNGEGRLVSLRDVTQARRREEARDLFVTVTSHELRTPVTVIKGAADTLTQHWDQLDEPSRREWAQRLGQRATELATLVERLLSAVGDGSSLRGELPMLPFDLGDVIRAALGGLPADVERLVCLDVPAAVPKAMGDRASLTTVLAELVTNAAKYSGRDKLIDLTAFWDRRVVGFRVADRGIGIPAEHVERAFERFWQADSGERHRRGGVGLGLYLVRQLLERQHGWVSLRPRDGGGTVAEVRLPRADLVPGEA